MFLIVHLIFVLLNLLILLLLILLILRLLPNQERAWTGHGPNGHETGMGRTAPGMERA